MRCRSSSFILLSLARRGIVKTRAGVNHFLRSLVLRLSPVLSSPSACLWNSRTPAIDSRLSAQTILGLCFPLRTVPSEHKTGSRETTAMLRSGKVSAMAY